MSQKNRTLRFLVKIVEIFSPKNAEVMFFVAHVVILYEFINLDKLLYSLILDT